MEIVSDYEIRKFIGLCIWYSWYHDERITKDLTVYALKCTLIQYLLSKHIFSRHKAIQKKKLQKPVLMKGSGNIFFEHPVRSKVTGRLVLFLVFKWESISISNLFFTCSSSPSLTRSRGMWRGPPGAWSRITRFLDSLKLRGYKVYYLFIEKANNVFFYEF